MLLRIAAVAILIATALCQSTGFTKDGGLQQVEFAQNSVNSNVNERTLVAVKYRACSVVLDIAKRDTRIRKILQRDGRASAQSLGYFSDNVACLLVGVPADCERVRVLCNDIDSASRSDEGEPLSAPRLALLLADEAQRRSMEASASRKLAVNALLVDTRPGSATAGHSGYEYGDIYIVDTSGSYVQAKAGCVGARAERVTAWLGTRGRYLAGRWQRRQRPSTHSPHSRPTDSSHNTHNVSSDSVNIADCVNSTVAVSNNSVQEVNSQDATADDDSLRACLDLAAHCLQENYHRDAISAGNYSVSLTMYQGGGGGTPPR
jgi:20S proteasome alpha/beta subunit